MHRLPCAAHAFAFAFGVAIVGATQLSAAAPQPGPPPADAASSSVRCAAQHESHRFVRGSADFDTAMAFLAEHAALPSGTAKLVLPQAAASIEVSVDLPTACDGGAAASPARFCATTDCPFAPGEFPSGTALAMQTCAGGMLTAVSWRASKDGWMLTRAAQELTSRCDPPG